MFMNEYERTCLVCPKSLRRVYGFAEIRRELPAGKARQDRPLRQLRAEFGFEGIVMTDWVTAGYENELDCLYPNSDAHDVCMAGGDLFMPGSKKDQENILAALKEGRLSRNQLENNASRVVRLARTLRSAGQA